jgi:hypothetical protein
LNDLPRVNQRAVTELVPAGQVAGIFAVSPGDREKRLAGANDMRSQRVFGPQAAMRSNTAITTMIFKE